MKELTSKIFNQESNENVVHSALIWYLASQRRGTHSAKTRSEVSGGGRKPWRQKGTGRARAGSNRSPLWRKGGVTFGPKPRNYGYALPKKMRKLALKIALSDKAKENKVMIVPEFAVDQPKTKLAAKFMKDQKIEGSALLILGKENSAFIKAARNLAGVKPIMTGELNIHDLLQADWVVADKDAVKKLEEALS
jgi:large subunit ribosomal protein L4